MAVLTQAEWEAYTARFRNTHILQSATWGELKSGFGWNVSRVAQGDSGAQILFRKLPLTFSLAYIPKGPLGEMQDWENLWPEIDQLCRHRRAILLVVEPDLWIQGKSGQFTAPPQGFQAGAQTIQPPRTSLIDLSGDETELLARMKQKTRYNIRLAEKRGIRVGPSDDIDLFSRLMVETGSRDNFGVHSLDYYRRAYELFSPSNVCELLVATYQDTPLAALLVFRNSFRAWYLYGASSDQYRELMPTYLLQWEAMKWARAHGCLEYDLWGVPDEEEAMLESRFLEKSNGLWGVYRFKRGFGGKIFRAAGPWDRVYNPLLYKLYRWWVKRRSVE